jgi:hypothetical protein
LIIYLILKQNFHFYSVISQQTQFQYLAMQQQQMSSHPMIMSAPQPSPAPTFEHPAIPPFKATALPVGSVHEVVISYIEDGPTLFTIQLKQSEKDLDALNYGLSTVKLRALDGVNCPPTTGQACIARFSRDQKLYRAVILAKSTNSCTVTYG